MGGMAGRVGSGAGSGIGIGGGVGGSTGGSVVPGPDPPLEPDPLCEPVLPDANEPLDPEPCEPEPGAPPKRHPAEPNPLAEPDLAPELDTAPEADELATESASSEADATVLPSIACSLPLFTLLTSVAAASTVGIVAVTITLPAATVSVI